MTSESQERDKGCGRLYTGENNFTLGWVGSHFQNSNSLSLFAYRAICIIDKTHSSFADYFLRVSVPFSFPAMCRSMICGRLTVDCVYVCAWLSFNEYS